MQYLIARCIFLLFPCRPVQISAHKKILQIPSRQRKKRKNHRKPIKNDNIGLSNSGTSQANGKHELFRRVPLRELPRFRCVLREDITGSIFHRARDPQGRFAGGSGNEGQISRFLRISIVPVVLPMSKPVRSRSHATKASTAVTHRNESFWGIAS